MGMQAIIQATAGGRSLLAQTPAAGSIPYGASGTTYGTLSPGTSGQVLATQGAAAPVFAWANQTNAAYNGGFDILQRQLGTESTETAYTDDAYAFDRWNILTQTASVQCSRQAGDTRSRYCGRIKQNQASAQRAGMVQILDADTTRRFVSQVVRAQLRVKCSSSQAIRIALIEWTGTADSPVSDPVNDWTSATFTVSNFFKSTTTTIVATATVTPTAATWTDLSVTGTVSSGCTNLMLMVWSEGTMAQNVTLDVTEVGIFHGAEGRLWMPEDPTAALLRCQRFFIRLGQARLQRTFAARYTTTFILSEQVEFSTPMRATPTLASSTPTWATVAPTGNTVAALTSAGAYTTISGALTVSGNLMTGRVNINLTAGTSFSGSAGAFVYIEVGDTMYADLTAEL